MVEAEGALADLPQREWRLEKETEVRLEVDDSHPVTIKLVEGTAEIFGTELAKNRPYVISPRSKIAIFSWFEGCKVLVYGEPAVSYVSDQTPMLTYINTHMAIDQLRDKLSSAGRIGPKVMLVGPTDVGKSTLCRILCNYAVRMDREPCFVDIDVGQNSITIPGMMGILPIERPCDIETGEFNKKASLVYHYGYSSPGPNLKLYKTVVTAMAKIFEERCKVSPATKVSGCIINTCGWVDGQGYQALLHAAQEFKVEVVLVMDHERLYNDLQRDLPSGTEVVPLSKSGGVVVRDRQFRKQTRENSVREFYYGLKSEPLFPFSFDVPFGDVKIFKIGAPSVPDSALPLGMTQEDGSTQVIPEEPSKELVHVLLSLSMASSEEEDLVSTPVAGFLTVTAVDMEKKVLTVLSPAPRPLPRNFLLLSDIKFIDLK